MLVLLHILRTLLSSTRSLSFLDASNLSTDSGEEESRGALLKGSTRAPESRVDGKIGELVSNSLIIVARGISNTTASWVFLFSLLVQSAWRGRGG